MSSPNDQPINDESMIRYLLSELSEGETERLDQLSIVDEEFAWRLSAAENDLIDGYLRGELSEERQRRFKSRYANRPEKIRFAEALLRREQSTLSAENAPHPIRRLLDRPWLQLGAIAASLIVLTFSYFLYQRLHRQSDVIPSVAVRSGPPAPALPQGEKTTPPAPSLKTVAFVLMPATRAPGRLPTFKMEAGTDIVLFRLRLELDEFPHYRVTLTDLALDKVSWRSNVLRPEPHGKEREIAVRLPADILNSRDYSFDVSGIPAAGPPEVIASYTFKLVIP